jgi:DnaK suppressor protein
VSTVLHWSDSRKRSRFTAAGGVAVTAIPMSDLRQLLDELHASTESRLSAVSDTAKSAPIPGTLSDGGPCIEENRPALLRRLMEVEAAQQRIADGSYGVCLGCGRLIPVARLQVHPYTSCCQACQISLTGSPDDGESWTLPALRRPSGRVNPATRRLQNEV